MHIQLQAVFVKEEIHPYIGNPIASILVGCRCAVSLKGDDHHKASSGLPDDFPDVDRWSGVVTDLYEHRLRADYDNWQSTAAENLLTPDEAFNLSTEFVNRCRAYLSKRLGASI